MPNPNVEQLENTISAYINSIYKDVPPTEEEFKEKADLMRTSMAVIMPVYFSIMPFTASSSSSGVMTYMASFLFTLFTSLWSCGPANMRSKSGVGKLL